MKMYGRVANRSQGGETHGYGSSISKQCVVYFYSG